MGSYAYMYLLTIPSSLALHTSLRPLSSLNVIFLTGSQSAPTSSALTTGPSGTTLARYGSPSAVAMAKPTPELLYMNARSSITDSRRLKDVKGIPSERVSYTAIIPEDDPVASR
jgi:hypothetical protein